jgi:hypothetical protein
MSIRRRLPALAEVTVSTSPDRVPFTLKLKRPELISKSKADRL